MILSFVDRSKFGSSRPESLRDILNSKNQEVAYKKLLIQLNFHKNSFFTRGVRLVKIIPQGKPLLSYQVKNT
jgi:hypothetical protein